jgi:hypothetical protein
MQQIVSAYKQRIVFRNVRGRDKTGNYRYRWDNIKKDITEI